MIELDPTDRRLLEILQQDARQSNAELAVRVGLSSSSCHRRVGRLEQAGVIGRYVALLDPEALGLTLTVFVEVALKGKDRETRESFAAQVGLRPEVLECHIISGEYDNMLRVIVADIASFRKFILDDLLAIPEVEKTRSSMSLGQWKNTTALPLSVS